MEVSDQLLVSRKEGLIEAEVDGEIVALHVELGTCFGFNQTATRVWRLLEGPRTIAELREALSNEFEVDPAECEAQLRDLLKDLEKEGLVEVSST